MNHITESRVNHHHELSVVFSLAHVEHDLDEAGEDQVALQNCMSAEECFVLCIVITMIKPVVEKFHWKKNEEGDQLSEIKEIPNAASRDVVFDAVHLNLN